MRMPLSWPHLAEETEAYHTVKTSRLSCNWLMTGQTLQPRQNRWISSHCCTPSSQVSVQNVSDNSFTEGLLVALLGKCKWALKLHSEVYARSESEALTSQPSCLNVLLCFSVGKSHRRDAPDSLQQAPHVAVTTSAEENVRCLWLLQVLWDWENCDLQWLWKPGLTGRWSTEVQETSAPRQLSELMLLYLHIVNWKEKNWLN